MSVCLYVHLLKFYWMDLIAVLNFVFIDEGFSVFCFLFTSIFASRYLYSTWVQPRTNVSVYVNATMNFSCIDSAFVFIGKVQVGTRDVCGM